MASYIDLYMIEATEAVVDLYGLQEAIETSITQIATFHQSYCKIAQRALR